MSISMQTITLGSQRAIEIAQTEKILCNLRKEQAEVRPLMGDTLKKLGANIVLDLWNEGMIQNTELAEIIINLVTITDGEKIVFLQLLVRDSDLNNGITAYKSILKNQKRKMKEQS